MAVSDASFAGNYDLSSQLGCIVVIADKTGLTNIPSFTRHKAESVVRSVSEAKKGSLDNCFASYYSLQDKLQRILEQKLPSTMLTDYGCFFVVIVGSPRVFQKCLMIDINAAMKAYEHFENDSMGRIFGKSNCADGFTKFYYQNILEEFIDADCFKYDMLQ